MTARFRLMSLAAPRSLAALLVLLGVSAQVLAAQVSAAQADEPEHARLQKSAFAGRTITLDTFTELNPDCSNAGYADVRVSGASRGRVQVRRERAFPAFEADSGRQRCNSRRVPSVVVRYTPERGIRTPDTVKVDIVWHDGVNWTRTYDVTIR